MVVSTQPPREILPACSASPSTVVSFYADTKSTSEAPFAISTVQGSGWSILNTNSRQIIHSFSVPPSTSFSCPSIALVDTPSLKQDQEPSQQDQVTRLQGKVISAIRASTDNDCPVPSHESGMWVWVHDLESTPNARTSKKFEDAIGFMFIYRRNVLLVHKSASLSLVAADSLDTLASAQSTTSHDGFLLIQAELMGSRVVILGLLNGQVVMRIVSIVEQQDGQVDFEVVAEEVILQTKNFHILLATHDDKVAIIQEFSNTLFVYSVSTRETRTYNFPVKARSINFLSKDYVAIAHGDTIRVFDLVYGASHSTIDLPMQGIPTRLSIEHMESETGDNLMVTFTTKASKMATTFLLPYYAAPLTLLSCLGKITRQNSAPFPKWPTMMAKIAQKDLPGFQAEFSELVKRSDDENTEERSIPACLTPQVMCTLMKSLLEAFETLPDNIVSYMLSARVSPKSGIVDHLMRKLNFPLIAQCVSLDLTMQDITNLFQLSFEHNEIDIVKSLIQKYGTESGLSYTLRALNMTQVETCLSSCVDWLQEKDWVQPDDDHETILTFLSSVIDAHLPMILMTPPLHPYLTALKLIVGDHRKEMEITRREMSGVLGEFSMKKQVQHAGNRVKQMMNMTRDGVGRYRIEVVEF